MKLLLPKFVLEWIDKNRGELSRQSFIVNHLKKLAEGCKEQEH